VTFVALPPFEFVPPTLVIPPLPAGPGAEPAALEAPPAGGVAPLPFCEQPRAKNKHIGADVAEIELNLIEVLRDITGQRPA